MTKRIFLCESKNTLFEKARDRVIHLGSQAIHYRNSFRIALAGGSTPRGLYQALSSHPNALPWNRVVFFFGDERSVGPDHPDSNFHMAHDSLLAPLQINPTHIHRLVGEATDLDQAARDYEAALLKELGPMGQLDLVLLGMGDDGHTASLFPYTAALSEQSRWVVRNEVLSLHTHRLTMTYRLLNGARSILFLVSGASKAVSLRHVLQGPPDPIQYPSQAIEPRDGDIDWLVDSDAAAQLNPLPDAATL